MDSHGPCGPRFLIGNGPTTSRDLHPIAHRLLVLRGQPEHIAQSGEEPSQTVESRRLGLVGGCAQIKEGPSQQLKEPSTG